MTDRRTTPRVGYDARDEGVRAASKNIGAGGICLNTENPLVTGNFIYSNLSLYGLKPIRTIGRIAWSKRCCSGGFDNGVEFYYLDEDDRIYLNRFIEKELRKREAVHAE